MKVVLAWGQLLDGPDLVRLHLPVRLVLDRQAEMRPADPTWTEFVNAYSQQAERGLAWLGLEGGGAIGGRCETGAEACSV